MTCLVQFETDAKWVLSLWSLRDADECSTLIEIVDGPIIVEGLVCQQSTKIDALNQRRDAHSIMAVVRQEFETHQIAQSIGQGQCLGGQSSLRLAYGLALSPSFAPCPWR